MGIGNNDFRPEALSKIDRLPAHDLLPAVILPEHEDFPVGARDNLRAAAQTVAENQRKRSIYDVLPDSPETPDDGDRQ